MLNIKQPTNRLQATVTSQTICFDHFLFKCCPNFEFPSSSYATVQILRRSRSPGDTTNNLIIPLWRVADSSPGWDLFEKVQQWLKVTDVVTLLHTGAGFDSGRWDLSNNLTVVPQETRDLFHVGSQTDRQKQLFFFWLCQSFLVFCLLTSEIKVCAQIVFSIFGHVLWNKQTNFEWNNTERKIATMAN